MGCLGGRGVCAGIAEVDVDVLTAAASPVELAEPLLAVFLGGRERRLVALTILTTRDSVT